MQVSSGELGAPLMAKGFWGLGHKKSPLVQYCFEGKEFLDGTSRTWSLALGSNKQVFEESIHSGMVQGKKIHLSASICDLERFHTISSMDWEVPCLASG